MRLRHAKSALACLLAASFAIAGCGSSDSDSSITAPTTGTPAPPKSEFPSTEGRSLAELVKSTGRSELAVAPAASAFYRGENRYPFGVFDLDHTPVADVEVALYIAKAPRVKKGAGGANDERGKGAAARARDEALDQPAIGPFPAAVETLATQPAFRAQTTTSDPDAATVVYASEIDFPADGEWGIAAMVKDGGELTATLLPSAVVGELEKLPRVGERAPTIHTLTAADVGGDLEKITTRVPPDTQNRVDFADALGKEPIVLLFATPQFCQSRVCGPVVDVAEQVKQVYGDRAAFIHMEIFNENEPEKGVRPQVRAYHLPSEPWLFVIDRDGTIQTAVEGAFGVGMLTRAVKRVAGE